MKLSTFTSTLVLAFALMFAPAAFAQHGGHNHGGSQQSGSHQSISHRHQQPQHQPSQQRGQNRDRQDRDRNGRSYDGNRFGRDHVAAFDRDGGRFWHGRREYFFGGFWFYYGQPWPDWFYGCGVYFDLGPDGYWYAYSSCDPGLFIQVDID